MITAGAIVQLSSWASLGPLNQDEDVKQSIGIIIGVLKALGEVWPSSKQILEQVDGVAREIFGRRAALAEDLFWNTFTEEDVLGSMDGEGILDVSQLM
jgi:hypothetical protein